MRIFVAGPYGDHLPKDQIAENVRLADEAGRAIARMGHVPFVPHKMTHGLEDDPAVAREGCLRIAREWLALCHGLLFLASSPGADDELALARLLGLQIFRRLEEIPPVAPGRSGHDQG